MDVTDYFKVAQSSGFSGEKPGECVSQRICHNSRDFSSKIIGGPLLIAQAT